LDDSEIKDIPKVKGISVIKISEHKKKSF